MTAKQANDNNESKLIRVGIIGMGFMGNVHLKAYKAAKQAGYSCELVAVCDSDASRLTGKVNVTGNIDTNSGNEIEQLFDPGFIKTYIRPTELLANPEIDLVSICTHTDTHADLAIKALNADKHVLVEKPVATNSKEVQRLLDAVENNNKLNKKICMPAMCMRFWPGWDWLKDKIDQNTYGSVKSATFRRLGILPRWASNFYGNPEKSGGALVDLHVHDADFICHILGQPDSVITNGTLDHISTVYSYKNGPAHVAAEGGWDHTPNFNFRMNYIVVFENATAEFDSGKAPGSLVLFQNDSKEIINLEPRTGYDGEIRALLNAINGTGEHNKLPTITQNLAVTQILEKEHESMVTGKVVVV